MPTLNPSYITGQLSPMPQISGRATTSAGGIDTTPIGVPTMSQSVQNGSNLWQTALQAFMNNNPIGSAVGSAVGLLGGILDRNFERKEAEKQRQWNEEMVDKQNEWSLNMWNKTNAYNSPAAQKQRLLAAGLNPLYYGLDGSSANGLESAQPLGYDRASAKGLLNPLQSGFENYMQSAMQSKQLEAMDAQINKTKGETNSITLDNEFAKKTFNARAEGIELSNRLTKEQIKKIGDERGKIAVEIKKIAAETENEYEKKILMQFQERMLDVQAQEIVQLLPYKQLLLQAQTSAQRAQAALASAQAAIQNGLIEKGYIDVLFDQAQEELNLKKKQVATEEQRRQFTEAQSKLNDFRNNVYNGRVFDENTWNEANPFERGVMSAFNGLFNVMSIVTTAVGAPFTKILGM